MSTDAATLPSMGKEKKKEPNRTANVAVNFRIDEALHGRFTAAMAQLEPELPDATFFRFLLEAFCLAPNEFMDAVRAFRRKRRSLEQ